MGRWYHAYKRYFKYTFIVGYNHFIRNTPSLSIMIIIFDILSIIFTLEEDNNLQINDYNLETQFLSRAFFVVNKNLS